MSRPEHLAPPEVFYNEDEASKYTSNSRMISVQKAMSERCIEMLLFGRDEKALVLDIGCGSGLSGDALSSAGHAWVGLDVSPDMLDIAVGRGYGVGSGGDDECGCGELVLGDMGQGFGFRAGMFDGAISVSALQWLCYNDRKNHKSAARLQQFFSCLYRSLRRGARAALQFFPENEAQLELITASALRCGFTGGLVVDFPNSKKAKKYYLCLIAGGSSSRGNSSLPAAKVGSGGILSEGDEGEDLMKEGSDGEDENDEEEGADGMEGREGELVHKQSVPYEGRRGEGGTGAADKTRRRKGGNKKIATKSRAWILAKKDGQRRRGLDIRPDSKYTGRKRGPKF